MKGPQWLPRRRPKSGNKTAGPSAAGGYSHEFSPRQARNSGHRVTSGGSVLRFSQHRLSGDFTGTDSETDVEFGFSRDAELVVPSESRVYEVLPRVPELADEAHVDWNLPERELSASIAEHNLATMEEFGDDEWMFE